MLKYIKSKIDNTMYCNANGQFKRHLDQHGLTFRQYWETYVTKITEMCPYCAAPKTFYRAACTYARTCGGTTCTGLEIKETKAKFTEEKRQEITAKRFSTCLILYGTEVASKSGNVKEKMKNTRSSVLSDGRTREAHIQESAQFGKLLKYGDRFYNNSEKIAATKRNRTLESKSSESEKRRQTMMERYGVENVFQIPGNERRPAKGNASIKSYTLPSGKMVGIRGYEGNAIDMLLERLSEDMIEVSNSYAPTESKLPIFDYVNLNQHRCRYFPDIFIPSENLIIEVKSRWWYDANGRLGYESRLVNNLKKKQAAIDAGYNFEFWVFTPDGSLEVIK